MNPNESPSSLLLGESFCRSCASHVAECNLIFVPNYSIKLCLDSINHARGLGLHTLTTADSLCAHEIRSRAEQFSGLASSRISSRGCSHGRKNLRTLCSKVSLMVEGSIRRGEIIIARVNGSNNDCLDIFFVAMCRSALKAVGFREFSKSGFSLFVRIPAQSAHFCSETCLRLLIPRPCR